MYFWDRFKEALAKMLNAGNIKAKLNTDIAASQAMLDYIQLWGDMYKNKPPWSDKIKTLNLPATIAAEMARLVTVEHKITITGSRGDFLSSVIAPLSAKLRVYAEYACAKGGIAFKPYVDNGKIAIDIVQADNFYPTAYDSSGNITSAIFMDQKIKGPMYYTRLEYHDFNGGTETIKNFAYKSFTKNDLGQSIPLTAVPEWADIQPEVTIANLKKPLFAYFKMPLANSIDPSSPLGVSIYARAVDLIQAADEQYNRLLWEFEGSELAVHADITLFGKNGMPKLNNRLFKAIDVGQSGFYEVYSPAIRDQSLINGLNELLMRIEDACLLSRGTFSRADNVAKTATELKIMRQRTYAAVSDMQRALQNAIDDLIYACDVMATLYNLAPAGNYDVAYEWDDSIVADTDAEFARRLQLVASGIISPAELRAWYLGETLEQAMQNLPSADDGEV